MKSIFTILIFTNILFASTGASLYAKCTGCHGTKGEKSALDKSAVIGGQSTKKTIAQLIDYKYGTLDLYGLGSVMQAQVVNMSTDDIAAVAVHIKHLKKVNSVNNTSELSLSSNSFEDAKKAYDNKEYGKAMPIFKELCNNNNVNACRKVGEMYQYGYTTNGIKDMKQASKYYEEALAILNHLCMDKKDKLACRKLGDMYGSGYVAKQHIDSATKYNRIGCDLGDAESCLALSGNLGSEHYKKKATKLYELSCSKGNLQSCKKIGKPHHTNTRSYCEKVSGGSYVLMELCIKQENAARDRLGY